ncbi:hypothetical protein DL98DRAFT_598397 [Cadophora sp. DSE1049]|nr:hypothetical protein DL98DRAFT_598397 [Cadophora sp. DSE1049]
MAEMDIEMTEIMIARDRKHQATYKSITIPDTVSETPAAVSSTVVHATPTVLSSPTAAGSTS